MIQKVRAAGLLLIVLPLTASAAIENWEDVEGVIRRLTNWIFGILILFSIVMIMWSAFLYMTAGGDPEKVKQANHNMLYVAIALAIALLAGSVPPLVRVIILGTE